MSNLKKIVPNAKIILKSDFQPIIQPVIQNVIKPVIQNVIKPVIQNVIKPVIKPVIQNVIQNTKHITNKKSKQNTQPIKTKFEQNVNKNSKQTVYIVDFLNIFSDFREIKYKKENIDFHSVKHNNKEKDTLDFFDLFFTKYINHVNIHNSSQFYFVMKKLNDYEKVLDNVMKIHKFNMKFIIIEDKYNNDILDKNKDDFLCQYFFYILQKSNDCVLISNDKYRDKKDYIKLFNFDIFIRMIHLNKKTNLLEKSMLKIQLNENISNHMIIQKYTRCTIPKRDLGKIL
jgi:hypothetical protein